MKKQIIKVLSFTAILGGLGMSSDEAGASLIPSLSCNSPCFTIDKCLGKHESLADMVDKNKNCGASFLLSCAQGVKSTQKSDGHYCGELANLIITHDEDGNTDGEAVYNAINGSSYKKQASAFTTFVKLNKINADDEVVGVAQYACDTYQYEGCPTNSSNNDGN